MIFDDYVGKRVTITAEGGQNLDNCLFLGLESVGGLVFIRAIHYFERETNHYGNLMYESARDDVFIQLRKVKSLHFEIDAELESKIIEIYFDDDSKGVKP